MDVVERLTLEAAQEDTMLACEHRQRYELAAAACSGMRVLDLCCGSGYGSRILAASAREVVGVDIDVATIELARATVGRQVENVSFEASDAIGFLRGEIPGRFDLVVCFEGLEHLRELGVALDLLAAHAAQGLRLIVSLPNDRGLGVENPYHVTRFGWHEVQQAFAPFPSVQVLPQFLAEGSLICPEGASEVDVAVSLEDRDELEYANHFIILVNLPGESLRRAHRGYIQLNTSPIFNRWSEDLKRGAWELRRENARLGRRLLGRGGAAAAEAVAGRSEQEARAVELAERAARAERRVRELERALLDQASATGQAPSAQLREFVPSGRERVTVLAGDGGPSAPGLEWVEGTVSLRGKRVLALGGDAELAGALRSRGAELLGDPAAEGLIPGEPGTADVALLGARLRPLDRGDPVALLRELRQRLVPGGLIVLHGVANRLLAALDPERAGIGFRELELALEGPVRPHLLSSAYDPLLLVAEPADPAELALAQELDRVRPELAGSFSRRRLNLILSASPAPRSEPLLRPWLPHTVGSFEVALSAERTLLMLGPRSRLEVAVREPSRRLVVGVRSLRDEPVLVEAAGGEPDGALCAKVDTCPAGTAYVSFAFAGPRRRFGLRASAACEIVFAGYEE